MKRRDHIKGLMMLPLAGAGFPMNSFLPDPNAESGTDVTDPKDPKPNIFQSIGVEPIINCRGTFTIIGGSLERPEVRAAMEAASHNFVQYDELADGVGRRLAQLTGAEWGMVSAGCAAGMKHITSACVTGGNPEKLIRIPDLTGFDKTEVIIPRHSRNTYDHAIRNIGVKIITVETMEELENAINARTAMVYLMAFDIASSESITLESVVKLTKPKNIPVMVDAAAENLTIPCVHLQRGADVVVYSGGKAICGPQCAGLVLGRKDILMSAWQASSPHHGPGRDNKVGREEMMGMVAAVEAWISRDHAAEWKRWLVWLDTISKRLAKIDGLKTSVFEPTDLSNKSPVLNVSWDAEKLNITAEEIVQEVGYNKPRIALGGHTGNDGVSTIQITTGQMQPGQEIIVGDRLFGLLSQKRTSKSGAMAAASSNLSGRWDLTVEFFSSKSQHTLIIDQDGNWITGSHQGEFSTRDMIGMIEGDQVKLRSVDRLVADGITFIFSGSATSDSMSGQIHLGEYRTAKFTAKRHETKKNRQKISVPVGAPLAT